MSPKLQVKLLRVLEDGRVEPVGSVTTHQVNVRIIAATNRNLQDPVASCTFREDLYYRLRVVPIEMPPLRRRREDIPLLVRHFLHDLHTRKSLRQCNVSDDAMDALVVVDLLEMPASHLERYCGLEGAATIRHYHRVAAERSSPGHKRTPEYVAAR